LELDCRLNQAEPPNLVDSGDADTIKMVNFDKLRLQPAFYMPVNDQK
jgi:hypothetical protein